MRHETILLDIETQRDFLAPGGSCYRPPARDAARNIARLFAWARTSGVPVLSTVLRVRPGDAGPMAPAPHCVEGTVGEAKMPRTLLPRRIDLGLRVTTDLPAHIFQRYQQVIFEKRHTDIFAHARIERLITELPPTTFIICGAGLSTSIVQAAVGLRARGFAVVLADDAVVEPAPQPPEMAYLRMRAKRVIFVPTAKIVSPPPRPRRRPFRARMLQRAERQAF